MAQVPIDDPVQMTTLPVPVEGTPAEVHERGASAALVAVDHGRDPAQEYAKATESNDLGTMLDVWTKSVEEDRMNVLSDSINYLSPEQIQSEVQQTAENLSGPINAGNYIETIKSMPSSVGKSDEQIKKEAVYMQMRETISQAAPAWSDMSAGEIAGTIGGILIPKRKEEALVDFMSKMGFIDSFTDKVDVFVDPTEEIIKMRNMFWSLDDEGQIAFMESLAEYLPYSTDNPLIRQEIVNDILGEDFSPEMSSMFALLDTVDVSLIASGIAKLGKNMVRTGKLINLPRRLEEPQLAADMIDTAVKNPEAAAKVGVTQADVGDSLNPLINGEISSLLTGATADQAAPIVKMMQMQDARFAEITDEMARHGLWSQDTLDDIMRRAEDKIVKQPGVENASVSMVDETQFKLQWTEVFHDSLGRRRKRSKETTVDFTVNDLGELDARKALDQEWVAKDIRTTDPNAKMQGMLRQEFVTTVEALARKQEATAKAFKQMMRDAYKGLSRKSAKIVDDVLQKGSKNGHTYTFEELVDGAAGYKLTDAEAKAYIGTRNVVEKLYRLKNKQITDTLQAQGLKVFDSPEGGAMAVRMYDDPRAALTSWKQVGADSHHILIPEGGLRLSGLEAVEGVLPLKGKAGLTKAMLEEAYQKGYVLARNHAGQNLFRKGDKLTQWAFVRRKNVHSPKGKQMLHRIEGYMPKQRTGSFWFIKKPKAVGLSGADDYTVSSTHAYSDNFESAQKWIDEHGGKDAGWEIVFDRDMTTEERMYTTAKTHGGMYSGSRKSDELEYVGLADESFANSFEALQHYINHIGRQYPATLYRLGSEQRLLALARGLGVTGRDLSMHNVARRALDAGFTQQSKEYQMLKGISDQMSFVNMIPTDDELTMATRLRTVGRFLENDIPVMRNAPKIFYNMAAKNLQPQDLIRGFAFNHLLGLYNPAQIIVQASGALVTMAIDPIGFPKHFSRMIAWRIADGYASDPFAQKKIIQWMKKNGFEQEAQDYELWSRSGFRQTVEQGNADYTSVFTRNMPYDMNIAQKVLANHTVFYKEGELINTRIAFSAAVDRYKKMHNVLEIDPTDAKALDEIGMWAEKLRLNMSRANQSDLNKGWKAVPFQFQQIIAKYLEKVMPKKWGGTDEFSSWEKFRLFAIPTAITGTAGMPLGNYLATNVLNMFGIEESDLTPEQVHAVRNGILGWLTNGDLLNIDFSTRMSLSGDFIKNMWEAFTVGKSWWQMAGPAATVADRYWRNMQLFGEALDLTTLKNEDFEWSDLEVIPAVIAEVASDIPTVTRNIKQYYSHLMTDNPQFIKDGKYLWDWETMTTATAFFGMMGFAPTEMTELYELDAEIRDSATSFSVWGDTDADVILRIMNMKMLNTGKLEESRLYAKVVNSIFKKYGPAEQRKLMSQVFSKASSRKFDQGNLVWKALLEAEARGQHDLNQLNSIVSRHLGERR